MVCFYRACCTIRACFLLGVCHALLLGAGSAQEGPVQVESQMRAFALTHTVDGGLIRTPVAQAMPGQIVEYELSYRNISDEALDDFILVGELPVAAEYLSAAALNGPKAVFEVSVADIGWVLAPAVRYVDDGKGILRPVAIPEKEFKALRWRMAEPIDPGGEVSAIYRVRLTK